MMIYLLRHGIAAPASRGIRDFERPLTDEGIEKLRQSMRNSGWLMPDLQMILSSPVRRAMETAAIVREEYPADIPLDLFDEISTDGNVELVLSGLRRYSDYGHILLVGHEPLLGFLASALLGIRDSVIDFKKGSLCGIEINSMPPRRLGVLQFHMHSKMLRSMHQVKD